MKQPFFARYAWPIILGLVALTPLIFWGVKETFRKSNNNVSQWLPQDYEETRTYQEFRQLFGSDDSAVISWDGCTLDDDRLEDLAGYLADDGSEWFDKVITGRQVLDDLMTGPAQLSRKAAIRRLHGTLIGPDLQTTCAVITLTEKGDSDRTGALSALEEIAESRCGLRRDQLRLGGDAVINAAIDIESKQAIRKWVVFAWGLAITFAWLGLRRFRLMVMVFAVSFYAAVLGTGLVHYTGGTMNLLLVLVPVLLFVLTLSASVHLSNYYRDAIREFGVVGAPLRAMASGWTPCALCAATTALGLGSLLVSHIQPVKSFGFYSSTGMLLSLGLLFLLLPTLMEKWPLKDSSDTGQSSADRRDRILRRVAGAIIRHNGPVALICLGILVTLGSGVVRWPSESDNWREMDSWLRLKTAIQPARFFPEDSRWIQDGDWYANNVGPLVTVEVVLSFDRESRSNMRQRMQLVREVGRHVHAMDEVGGTISAATFAPNLNPGRAVRQATTNALLERNREFFVKQGYLGETGEEERWRITARLFGGRDVYYDQVLASIQDRVDRYLEERGTSAEPVTAIYTGSAPLVFAAQQELLRGLMRSFCLAFALIAVVMVLLLRSVWAGALAMLPNVFPALVTFGAMGWIARPVDVGAMMTASVAMGIAVDDTLHFLTWFRRGRLRGDTREEAVIRAYQRCAPAMTQTTLIAGPALLVFYLSSFQPVSQFGLLMFILLAAALVGDLIFLPALLATRFGESFFRNGRNPKGSQPPEAQSATAKIPQRKPGR